VARKAAKDSGYEPYLTHLTLDRKAVSGRGDYPFCLPVVRNLKTIQFHPSITYIVGENGTGKSTLLEAIAVAAGFNAEGGSKNFRFSTQDTHSELHEFIKLGRTSRREKDGFFLRAESFYNVATELVKLDSGKAPPPTFREKELEEGTKDAIKELRRLKGSWIRSDKVLQHRMAQILESKQSDKATRRERELRGLVDEALMELKRLTGEWVEVDEALIAQLRSLLNRPDLSIGGGSLSGAYGGPLHEKSHGESFLALMQHRFRDNSLFILDEPESALSPARQLSILLRIHELVQAGCQFIIATHAPLLMAYPNSKMLLLTQDKIEETNWKETEHFTLTKSFLDRPETFLHHLLDG
jgi:predicted ATPase